MEEEAERIYICMYSVHDSGIRTLVAILQPGASDSLYITMSYVLYVCTYNNTYSLSRFFYLFIVLSPRGSSAGENP